MRDAAYRIDAVIFDFDGTLTRPGALDFEAIRQALGCPPGEPILEFLAGLPPEARAQGHTLLEAFEAEAAAASLPNDGAVETVRRLRASGVRVGIISRNSRRSIERGLANFGGLTLEDFDVVVSRDVPVRPKPAPDGLHLAAETLGLDVGRLLVVGDRPEDVEAGRAAGALTALLRPEGPRGKEAGSDFVVAGLGQLEEIVRLGRPLPQGKLPQELLEGYLTGLDVLDPAVIVAAGVGEDVAALDVQGAEVLVLKSDPITFATDSVADYLVMVNANDIATSGATPRWLLVTALFPPGSTASDVLTPLRRLHETCRRWGITLCGGHTEITDAVTRPVLVGMLAGTVARAALVDKSGVRSGDRILLTKGVAVEGTAILAREFGAKLAERGMSAAEIAECARLLEHIGVLEEAAVAQAHPGVSAMHDVTEGGLASALDELSVACHHRLRVDLESIPVLEQTRRVCALLELDPLGLIGSGSLLICCGAEGTDALVETIRTAGVKVAVIGEVLAEGRGVEARREGRPVPWPHFPVDELARLFARESQDRGV
ncbi:MAG: hypothetical protein Kow00122_13950 [Thermoleophilia bacterium]